MAKRKPDPAHLETDKIISKIEKRITREYTQALNELQEKVDDYFRRYEIKDATWQRWVKENKGIIPPGNGSFSGRFLSGSAPWPAD